MAGKSGEKIETAETGHLYIEEQRVHAFIAQKSERLFRVGCAADYIHPVGRAQQSIQPLQRERLIIDKVDSKQRPVRTHTVTAATIRVSGIETDTTVKRSRFATSSAPSPSNIAVSRVLKLSSP